MPCFSIILVGFFLVTSSQVEGTSNSNASKPPSFPRDLMYRGKPIDPYCISRGSEDIEKDTNSANKFKKTNITSDPNGYIEYNFTEIASDPEDNDREYYVGYKYLGTTKEGLHIIEVSQYAEGIHYNTRIDLMKRYENKIESMKTVDSTDYTDKLIYKAKFSNGKLTYGKFFNADNLFFEADFLVSHENGVENETVDFDGSENAAICMYQTDDFKTKKLTGIVFFQEKLARIKQKKSPSNFHECFDYILCEYTKAKALRPEEDLELTVAETKEFIEKVNKLNKKIETGNESSTPVARPQEALLSIAARGIFK